MYHSVIIESRLLNIFVRQRFSVRTDYLRFCVKPPSLSLVRRPPAAPRVSAHGSCFLTTPCHRKNFTSPCFCVCDEPALKSSFITALHFISLPSKKTPSLHCDFTYRWFVRLQIFLDGEIFLSELSSPRACVCHGKSDTVKRLRKHRGQCVCFFPTSRSNSSFSICQPVR